MMTRRPARPAFTLIELLVVIAIIGILMSLILPAVQKIRGKGPILVAKNDIEQMNIACTEFKAKYGFYPPCSFTFPTTAAHPSTEVFKRMFSRWTQAPVAPPAGFPATITGSQCLVYFLSGPGGTGWAVDAPIAPSANATAKNTFMDFLPSRVVNGAYLDPWKTPYMYLSSGDGGQYGSSAAFYPPNVPPVSVYSSGGKPVNPRGVQIISAGPNMTFGPGGAWTPGAGAYSSTQAAGGDDIANFNGGFSLAVQN